MLAETFLDLVRDLNHWGFEIVSDAVFGIVLYPAGTWLWRRALRRHDAEHHADQ